MVFSKAGGKVRPLFRDQLPNIKLDVLIFERKKKNPKTALALIPVILGVLNVQVVIIIL